MELYWLLRLPHLHELFLESAIICLVFGLLGLIPFFMSYVEDSFFEWTISIRWVWLKLLVLSFVFSVLACLCPSKTDLAIMMGFDSLNIENIQEVIDLLKKEVVSSDK